MQAQNSAQCAECHDVHVLRTPLRQSSDGMHQMFVYAHD